MTPPEENEVFSAARGYGKSFVPLLNEAYSEMVKVIESHNLINNESSAMHLKRTVAACVLQGLGQDTIPYIAEPERHQDAVVAEFMYMLIGDFVAGLNQNEGVKYTTDQLLVLMQAQKL